MIEHKGGDRPVEFQPAMIELHVFLS